MTNERLVCPECKMEHRAWKGNHGRGYAAAPFADLAIASL